jgi:tRNA-Thr(GGU) m(6)t(6)A37 methyltransferase TsaA
MESVNWLTLAGDVKCGMVRSTASGIDAPGSCSTCHCRGYNRTVNATESVAATLVLEPIGTVHTSLVAKVDAPRQPGAITKAPGTIELFPGRNFEHALEDLQDWELIWVVFWFHLNAGWRPKVLPPRSVTGRKGLFSTRSPHRPNPIGLSAVRLERVDGLTLHVRDVDMVDGTPVLDIKPYVPYADAYPGARSGWLERDATLDATPPADRVAQFLVTFEPLAAEQLAWIEERTGLALGQRVQSILSLGPAPHPYRRIRRNGDTWRLAIKDWRIRFRVDGREMRVIEIASGYRNAQLVASGRTEEDALSAHREFRVIWPDGGG